MFLWKGFTKLIMRTQNLSLQSTFPIKLHRNSNFYFLVNFNFVLSTWRISHVGTNFGRVCSMLFLFSHYYFKLWKRTKLSLLFRKNINSTQLTKKLVGKTWNMKILYVIILSFTRNSTPTNLGCKPRGLITENNNVCKTIMQEIYAVYYNIK